MLTYTNNIQELQIKAVQSVIDFLKADDNPDSIINCLTESLQMKKKALCCLLDCLENQALPLQHHGISIISVACIAESIYSEVTLQASMMELYAHHLSLTTHTPDILRAYQTISKHMTDKADSLLAPIRDKVNMAVNDAEIMEFAEGADVVTNLKRKININN